MSSRNPDLRYFAAGTLAPIIWGFFAFPLRSIRDYSAGTILYYRVFVSFVLMGAVVLLFRRNRLRQDWKLFQAFTKAEKRRFLLLLFISASLLCGNWLSYIYVINRVGLQPAAFAYMVCPIITALCSFFLLKERISFRKWLAIGVSFVSVLLLSWGFLGEVIWSVAVAGLFALYLVTQKEIRAVDRFNLLSMQFFLAALLVLPAFLWQHGEMPVEPDFWINILEIAVLFTIIPLYLNLYALAGIPSSTVGILIYINPIVAFAVAFLYFGEQAGVLQIVSYLVLLCAVVIFNWGYLSGLKRKPR